MLQKQQKIDYKVRTGRPISWPKALILNFLLSTGSLIPFKNLEIDLWNFQQKLMTKIEVIPQKLLRYAKIS